MDRMTQGIDRIPDSLGYLVLNEDGAIIASGGDLENEEKLADKLMTMVRTAVKVQTAGDKPANFKRLTVIWKTFMYMITISNHRVYICKRENNPQEPVLA